MVKRTIQADSASKTGLEYTLRETLIVVESGHSGGLRIFENQRRLSL